MNMNPISVNSFDKSQGLKCGSWLVASLLASSLLTACGGGSSSADASQSSTAAAQAAAQAAAAQAAAAAAAQAAAQAAAEKAAALEAAREDANTAATQAAADAKAAQTASDTAASAAQQAVKQGAAYQEASQSLSQVQTYASQASDAAQQAVNQQKIASQAEQDAKNAQDVDVATQAVKKAQAAAKAAQDARKTAEQALTNTQTAAKQVAAAVQAALASHYVKLDAGGNELSSSATSWSCVKDKNTGLVWEEKTNDNGLRDKDWRYRHMHNYGGYGNYKDTNGKVLCEGLNGVCDAYTYVNAVNGTGLCGRNTWRLPLPKEFGTIAQINSGSVPPHIDLNYFPETINIPTKGAYCSENVDGAEHNYQGVDFGLPILYDKYPNEAPANVLGVSILVPLRFYGEIQDGLVNNPGQASNWICYSRLVSSR